MICHVYSVTKNVVPDWKRLIKQCDLEIGDTSVAYHVYKRLMIFVIWVRPAINIFDKIVNLTIRSNNKSW